MTIFEALLIAIESRNPNSVLERPRFGKVFYDFIINN